MAEAVRWTSCSLIRDNYKLNPVDFSTMYSRTCLPFLHTSLWNVEKLKVSLGGGVRRHLSLSSLMPTQGFAYLPVSISRI